MAEGTERRGSERIPFPCEAKLWSAGLSALDARLSDLSVTGAFIDTVTELPVGSMIQLEFAVGATTVMVEAEVVHSMPQFGMGVRFRKLQESHRAAIEEAIRQQA